MTQQKPVSTSFRLDIRKNLNRELNQIDAINTILRNFTQFHTISHNLLEISALTIQLVYKKLVFASPNKRDVRDAPHKT